MATFPKTVDGAVLAEKVDALWRRCVDFPYPHVCKHMLALALFDLMEDLGYKVPNELNKAVTRAWDEDALAWPPLWKNETEKDKE